MNISASSLAGSFPSTQSQQLPTETSLENNQQHIVTMEQVLSQQPEESKSEFPLPDDIPIPIIDETDGELDPYKTIVTPLDPLDQGPPDGGYGWVIVVASFFVHFAVIGNLYSYSIFQRYLVTNGIFGPATTNTQVATVNGVATFVGFLLSPYIGRIADRIGYRLTTMIGAVTMCLGFICCSFVNQLWQLYLAYGILVAVGLQLAWIPSVSLVAQWFSKRRGLAVGIAVSGSGFGGLALAPLIQLVLNAWGWQWAFRVQGFVCLFMINIAALFFRERVKRVKPSAGFLKTLLSFCSIESFKNPKFSLQFLATFVAFFAYNVPFIMLVPFATSPTGAKLTPNQGALLLGLMNGFSGLGRVLLGFVSDVIGPVNIFCIVLTMAGLSILVIWSFATNFGVLLAFCLVYGMFGGALLSSTPIVTSALLGITKAATFLGQIYQSMSVGGLCAPLIAGVLVDAHTTTSSDGTKLTDWEPVILYTGFVMLCAAFIAYGLKFLAGHKNMLMKV